MLKTKLEIQKLIQENDENYLTYKTSELEYQIKDSILHEASMLLEYDEGDSHFKRNWGKYATGIGGVALANGGAFGAGAQHAVHTGLQAGKNMAHTAFDGATNGLKNTSNYYSHGLSDLDPNSAKEGGTVLPTPAAGVAAGTGINPTPTYYGNDGKAIDPASAHEFSRDTSYNVGDSVQHGVDSITHHAGGIAAGGLGGAGLGAAIGGKFGGAKGAKVGAAIGGGLGSLAGGYFGGHHVVEDK